MCLRVPMNAHIADHKLKHREFKYYNLMYENLFGDLVRKQAYGRA